MDGTDHLMVGWTETAWTLILTWELGLLGGSGSREGARHTSHIELGADVVRAVTDRPGRTQEGARFPFNRQNSRPRLSVNHGLKPRFNRLKRFTLQRMVQQDYTQKKSACLLLERCYISRKSRYLSKKSHRMINFQVYKFTYWTQLHIFILSK